VKLKYLNHWLCKAECVQFIHDPYIVKSDYWSMESNWKCFRCNLSFRTEEHAKIHNEITRHHTTSLKE